MPEVGRHDLVWLRDGATPEVDAAAGPEAAAAVRAWLDRALPLVATRRDPARPEAIALGLARPPGAPVRRIAVRVARAGVERVAPPLLLHEAVPSAPAAWRAALRALDREARRAGLTLRVHGSLAWQHLSGEAFVTGASDVDVLVAPRDALALGRALALLAGHEGPPRLDGEVLLPDGSGVAWRELASGAARVLVKRLDGVALWPRAGLP